MTFRKESQACPVACDPRLHPRVGSWEWLSSGRPHRLPLSTMGIPSTKPKHSLPSAESTASPQSFCRLPSSRPAVGPAVRKRRDRSLLGVIWPSQGLSLQPPNCLLVASTHLSKTTSRLHCIGHQFVSFVLIFIMRVSVRCPCPPSSDGQGAILSPRLYRNQSAHGAGGRGICPCLWRSVPPRGSGSVSRVTLHASCPPPSSHTTTAPQHICAYREDRPSPQESLGWCGVGGTGWVAAPTGDPSGLGLGVSETVCVLQAPLIVRIPQSPCQNTDRYKSGLSRSQARSQEISRMRHVWEW